MYVNIKDIDDVKGSVFQGESVTVISLSTIYQKLISYTRYREHSKHPVYRQSENFSLVIKTH